MHTIGSVTYQSFLLIMRRPFSLRNSLNRRFLENAFEFLDSVASGNESEISRSRVLGAPATLYPPILRIACGFTSAQRVGKVCGEHINDSLQHWHGRLTPMSSGTSPSMMDLYILAASFLYDTQSQDISLEPNNNAYGKPSSYFAEPFLCSTGVSPTRTRWQVTLALSYLRHPVLRKDCIVCYLSAWPLFFFGSPVESTEEIDFLRQLLSESRQITG